MAEENNDYRAQLSIKFGTGHMLNLRADSVEDLAAQAAVLEEMAPLLTEVSTKVQALAIEAILKAFPESEVVGEQKAEARDSARKPAPQAGGDGRKCAHGVVMAYKTGRSSKGPWTGYFCDVTDDPRLPKCQPQFLNG